MLNKKSITKVLVETGLWTAFRTRPYSKTPAIGSTPHSIFINAMDTNPLALDPEIVIEEYPNEFERGLSVISQLTDGKSYLCKEVGKNISPSSGIEVREFKGVHPAGNVGTHIHLIDPVSDHKTVWHIGYQDVIAIGKLFLYKEIWTERIVALGGPLVKRPRLFKTRIGANCLEVFRDELTQHEDIRIISGSVFKGHSCSGAFSYLGRFHNQVCVLKEGKHREFLGWISPGWNKFSLKKVFLSGLASKKNFSLDSNLNGSPRAMVPTGMYEKVLPFDIPPVPLLKSLITENTDYAQKLGVLELDEEDLALCTFVDTGKVDYGPILRKTLDTIEKEG
jgi:Na+-transporting NADH:ubiquinone oxidoreductase subunit A